MALVQMPLGCSRQDGGRQVMGWLGQGGGGGARSWYLGQLDCDINPSYCMFAEEAAMGHTPEWHKTRVGSGHSQPLILLETRAQDPDCATVAGARVAQVACN